MTSGKGSFRDKIIHIIYNKLGSSDTDIYDMSEAILKELKKRLPKEDIRDVDPVYSGVLQEGYNRALNEVREALFGSDDAKN